MQTERRCARCVMDNHSDPTIQFNRDGFCNYCSKALSMIGSVYTPLTAQLNQGNSRLDALIDKIKQDGVGKKYDCIMGLSGGLDSSYLAYLGYKWGLRILAVHIDDGYDTDISKSNLQKLVAVTGYDYEVITPDAEQYNDVTLALMKAGVPNIAAPQDNILSAFLYSLMKKNHIKYFLSGNNFATECILQAGNTYKNTDVINIKDIHRRFGTKPNDKLKFISTIQRELDRTVLGIETLCPLNMVDYNRNRAFQELGDFCGFQYYGRKHLENILTAFIQLYWFPKKFGVDKRTSHLSSLIVSGQMTRDEALRELEDPLYDENVMREYIQIIRDRMHLSEAEFAQIMQAPSHQHSEYAIEDDTFLYRFGKTFVHVKHFVSRQ